MRRRKPRLLMLLHGYYPDEARVAGEARAAVAAGFEVDVVALGRKGEAPAVDIDGVQCSRLPIEHARGAGGLAMMREYAHFTVRVTIEAARLHRRRRYDVVQVHGPPEFLVVAALIPRMLGGAGVVLDVHDLGSDMFKMRFGNRPGAGVSDRLLRLIERWAGRLSDEVLTVHDPYRRELLARGVPGDKITVVLNTLDERMLPPESSQTQRDGFVIVYHGSITPHYGVPLVVEAAALVRETIADLRVEIYGEGDTLEDVVQRARTLGLEDVLHTPGFLPHADVLRAAQSASVGVVPNLPTPMNQFALSTKLFDYVALGVPAVSADLPTIREYFSGEEVLFFTPGDASSLAAALLDTFRNPDAAAARAASARRRYESYRWSHNARTYVDVLTRAASRRR